MYVFTRRIPAATHICVNSYSNMNFGGIVVSLVVTVAVNKHAHILKYIYNRESR